VYKRVQYQVYGLLLIDDERPRLGVGMRFIKILIIDV